MGDLAVLILLLSGAFMLGWSTVLFVRDGLGEHQSDRLLAAGSSLVALVCYVGIYSGAVRALVTSILNDFWRDSTWRPAAIAWSRRVDDVVMSGVNLVNPGRDVGFQPHVRLAPLVLLVAVYACRWAIYRYANAETTPTLSRVGSVYWSHVTAYLMLVCFVVIEDGWSVWLVFPVSLAIVVVVLAGVRPVLGDIVAVGSDLFITLITVCRAGGRRVARIAALVATTIKNAFRTFSRWYDTQISKRLRAWAEGLAQRAKRIDLREQDGLKAAEHRANETLKSEEHQEPRI
ncbi:MAG: hypothetical protein U0P47_02195 [Acidimicrobiales bacterium]